MNFLNEFCILRVWALTLNTNKLENLIQDRF